MNNPRSTDSLCSRVASLSVIALCASAWFGAVPRSSAQWGHASDLQTPVCTVVGASVFDTRVISDGAGGLFAVWKDTRNSATGYDIYAQHIGANGRPLWT